MNKPRQSTTLLTAIIRTCQNSLGLQSFLGACKTWKTRGRLLRGEGCFSVVQLLSSNGTEEAFGWSVQIRTTTCWQFTCTVVDLIGFGEVDFDSASLSIQSKVKASVKTVRNARPKWTSCGTTRPLADGKNERERRISRKSYDMLWLCHNVQSFSK